MQITENAKSIMKPKIISIDDKEEQSVKNQDQKPKRKYFTCFDEKEEYRARQPNFSRNKINYLQFSKTTKKKTRSQLNLAKWSFGSVTQQ